MVVNEVLSEMMVLYSWMPSTSSRASSMGMVSLASTSWAEAPGSTAVNQNKGTSTLGMNSRGRLVADRQPSTTMPPAMTLTSRWRLMKKRSRPCKAVKPPPRR